MEVLHHFVPLLGAGGKDGIAVEDFGVEQQAVHIENDGVKRGRNHQLFYWS